MKKKYGIIIIITIEAVIANPTPVEIINEFQTDTTQQIEFYRIPPGPGGNLINSTIVTPGGLATVNTNLYLPDYGYAVINRNVLSGGYCLPPDSGFIKAYTAITYDSVRYSTSVGSAVPAPPPGASASKFYAQLLDGFVWIEIGDWYIDYTPTFGFANNNYPGCKITGHVYAGGNPIVGAQVTARCIHQYMNPPMYLNRATYTSSTGYYVLDSLLPDIYWVKVSASGYVPDSVILYWLRALQPSVVNFNLLVGLMESSVNYSTVKARCNIQPNPFRDITKISIQCQNIVHLADQPSSPSLKIYNTNGELIRTLPLNIDQNYAIWDGKDELDRDIPPGIYFCVVVFEGHIITDKIIRLHGIEK